MEMFCYSLWIDGLSTLLQIQFALQVAFVVCIYSECKPSQISSSDDCANS